jgi:hypothetical protein
MGSIRSFLIALVVGAGIAGLGVVAFAQEGPGGLINPGRDCQSLTTCQFKKGGHYRGCVSTYSCRVCRFVPARCQISGRSRICEKLRCTWGA